MRDEEENEILEGVSVQKRSLKYIYSEKEVNNCLGFPQSLGSAQMSHTADRVPHAVNRFSDIVA